MGWGQSFWLGRQDVGDKLVAAVDGTAPEARRHTGALRQHQAYYLPEALLEYAWIREIEY
ncbi:hypothetical protein ACFPC0_10060 [Streptomyces andamanensis]|uniref:Uncharacterized protein n=1 Tax=Streptomyces andamanensis TaxID=1565035 RepID=A0ABV8TCB7_9ACTN